MKISNNDYQSTMKQKRVNLKGDWQRPFELSLTLMHNKRCLDAAGRGKIPIFGIKNTTLLIFTRKVI